MIAIALHTLSPVWIGCLLAVLVGAAVQVTVGAGLSVISGSLLLLWLGPAVGVPILLGLNLLVSVVATAWDRMSVRWSDVAIASTATLAGCLMVSLFPAPSATAVLLIKACTLVVVALPRPPAPDHLPSKASASMGITIAGLVAGALTTWTATPGPIIPVALARAGRPSAEVRQTTQPVALVGYAAALSWVGSPKAGPGTLPVVAGLVAAALLGIVLGFRLRPRVNAARVVTLVRATAGLAALLLVVSVLAGH